MCGDKQDLCCLIDRFFGGVKRVADFGEIGLPTSPKSTGVVVACVW